MGLNDFAYWFWAVSTARFLLAFLFFQDWPKIATFLQALISLTFAFLLLILRLAAHGTVRPLHWPRAFKWIMVYILWNGLSLGWTFSDAFVSAGGYWVMMLLDVFIVTAMLQWGDQEGVAIASLKGLVAGVYFVDMIALLFASGDEHGRLGDPEFMHPNTLGHLTAIAGLASLFFWQRAAQGSTERRVWGISSILLSWMLIRTLSKTSIIGFTVTALLSIVLGSHFRLKAKLQVFFMAGMLALASYGLMSQYLSSYLDDTAGDITSLTGRTILWTRSWDMIVERPLTGYGILSFRNYGPQFWDIRIIHGHNEWVTQAFQLGFVGVVFAAMVYWSYYRAFRRATDPFKRKLGISILLFIVIEGVASAEAVGLLFPLPLLVLLVLWNDVDAIAR